MLKAARMSAKIELMPLLHGKVSVTSVQLYGFDIQLYQRTTEEKPNFQFLINTFTSKDSFPSRPDLRINSVLIRRGKISWNRLDSPSTPGRFNPNHIILDKFSATLSLKSYTADSLNLNLKKLSFEEHSGLHLKQLSFRISANRQKACIDRFVAELPHSRLALTPITLSYHTPKENEASATIPYFTFQGSIAEGTISLTDLTSFYPPLAQVEKFKELQPLHIEARFTGDSEHALISPLRLYSHDHSVEFEAPVTIRQLQNSIQRTIKADIQKLYISPKSVRLITERLPYPQSGILSRIQAMGPLQAEGTLSYHPKLINGQINLHTELGALSLSGSLTHKNEIQAALYTPNFNLGKLTDKEKQWGEIALNISGKGTLHQKQSPSFSLQGNIEKMTYKRHEYRDIAVNAQYKSHKIEADIAVNDLYLILTAQGEADIQSSTPYLKGMISIRNFVPHALALTTQHKETTFQGNINADFSGNSIENMEGSIGIQDFRMKTEEENYTTGPILFEAADEQGKRTLALHSDFIRGEMKGDFHLGTLITQCRKLLHIYIPSFVKEPQLKKEASDEVFLSMHIDNVEPIKKIFGIPLEIRKPSHINGYFNSRTQELDFHALFPSFNYAGQQLDNLRIMSGCFNDSLSGIVQFSKRIGKAPVDFKLQARAANDNVLTELNWTNHTENVYKGTISVDTRFMHDENRKLLTDIIFHPSLIIVNDSAWNVHSSEIHLAPGLASINKFTIEQDDRHLILDGRVSDSESDSLTVDLKKINLEYIFNIINFHAVDFAGQATGRIHAKRLMKTPEADARLHVEGFTFNKAYLGEMNLRGGWNKENNAISLNAHMADPVNRSMTQVNGDIRIGAAPKGGLDLMIRTENIDLSFLNQYTNGIFTGLYGRASGWTRVFGPFKGINLEGDMLVNEGGMKVNATEVDYRLLNDSVILRPDNIYFRNATVYDKMGSPDRNDHYATVNGVLRHSCLSHMTFDFDIDAHNILGYDVKEFGDNVFCGTAYATGNIGFNGRPGNLNIHINARPEENTLFVYNLSSPTTLTDNQFITYKHHTDSLNERLPDSAAIRLPEPESDIRINFHLNLTPEATMKILMDPKAGDYISLNGHGNIRANYYNKGDFTMYGTYTIDHGIYKLSLQDVIRKDFAFRRGGTIVFGGQPIQADLNLQAVYTVPSVSLNDLSARSTFSQNNVRVNCLMNLGGKAQSPQISFDFDLPNVNEDEKQMVKSLINTEEEKNMQVIYLLGIGRFYTYDYNNTGQSQSSVAMKSLLSSTLSGQLNQMFSTLLGNNSNWNIGTNLSTGEMGWSDMDVEGLLSGRLLNNRLLINGNFGYRDNNNTHSTNNFIGDFDLQWLLTKNGNISLKAYSKTNDRYFTKSSLTTQGVGLGLKKDFNTWRDVFRLFIPRKRRADTQK